jgi:hypothetical protein
MAHKKASHPERSFGVSVGGVLCVLAALLVWRGRLGRAEIVGAIGVSLVVLGLVYPRALVLPSTLWWKFAHALGYVNARVLLTVLFAIVLTPLGLVWRLIGHDPLARDRRRFGGWTPYPSRYRDRTHYRRMF